MSALALLGCGFGQATGKISGVVTDEAGTAVPGAYVTYFRTPNAPTDTVPVGEGQYTAATGQYSFANLIPATYGLCVQVAPSRGFPPLCGWTFTVTPPRTTLVAGQSATINITIRRGLRVQVRLNDPSKLLLTPGDRATTSFVTASYVKFLVSEVDQWVKSGLAAQVTTAVASPIDPKHRSGKKLPN